MSGNTVHVTQIAGGMSQEVEAFGARVARIFAVAIAVGLLMALISPLRTDRIAFLPRLAYWEIIMISGATLSSGISEGIARWGRLRSRPWLEVPFTSLLIALPLTLIVIATSSLFFGAERSIAGRLFGFFGMTWAICTAVHSLIYFVGRAPVAELPADPDNGQSADGPPIPVTEAQPSIARFMLRLPPALRNLSVDAIEAEDHFLRVHLETGQSVLIRARLSDAVLELPPDLGAQTHRSWWVARPAIAQVVRSDGRVTLKLRHGIEAPVSRSFYRPLKLQGWFADDGV